MSKLSIFDPDAIDETAFAVGRHLAAPTGSVHYPAKDELLNLHFKYIGLAYLRDRHRMLRSGLGAADVTNNWGHRYHFSDAELEKDFRRFEERAVEAINHERDRTEPRWWRWPPEDLGQATEKDQG